LDISEGLGNGYEEKRVSVYVLNKKVIHVFTYYATNTDQKLKPYEWYIEHMVRGAREHRLPEEYINAILAIESIPDPDISRHEQELSIYR
jgi:hypothetical protein